MRINANKIAVLILLTIIVSLLSGCTYFYPIPDRIYEPELIKQKDIELDFAIINKGNILQEYTIGADEQSYCEYVNDPKKTTIVNAEIGIAKVKKIYVREGDYVKEGDLLIEYEYEADKDKEFALSISKRRAELKYESAKIQDSQNNISKDALMAFENSYLSAKSKLDEFYAQEEKYTLKASRSGYIARIEGYSPYVDSDQDVSFHICNIEDGFILLYANESNDIAVFQLYVFRDNAKAIIYNTELGINEEAVFKMNSATFEKQYVDNLDYFYGEHVVYLVLEFANKKLPEGIGFKQKFSASLIQKEVYDVILVPRNAVESTVWNEYYVYRISSDDTLEAVYIKVGEMDKSYYEVLEGLQVGDKVLLK